MSKLYQNTLKNNQDEVLGKTVFFMYIADIILKPHLVYTLISRLLL